jgi:hypothetical protein
MDSILYDYLIPSIQHPPSSFQTGVYHGRDDLDIETHNRIVKTIINYLGNGN